MSDRPYAPLPIPASGQHETERRSGRDRRELVAVVTEIVHDALVRAPTGAPEPEREEERDDG